MGSFVSSSRSYKWARKRRKYAEKLQKCGDEETQLFDDAESSEVVTILERLSLQKEKEKERLPTPLKFDKRVSKTRWRKPVFPTRISSQELTSVEFDSDIDTGFTSDESEDEDFRFDLDILYQVEKSEKVQPEVCLDGLSLNLAVRCWLRKFELERSGPVLEEAGITKLLDLRKAAHEGNLGFLSKCKPRLRREFLRALKFVPHEGDHLAFLDLFSDEQWIDHRGADLVGLWPMEIYGSRIKAFCENEHSDYSAPQTSRDGIVHPRELSQIVESIDGDDLGSTFELSIVEELQLKKWSKTKLRVSVLKGEPVIVLIALGDDVYTKKLAPGDDVELDLNKIQPLGFRVGSKVIGIACSGVGYPEGPVHAGDNCTYSFFPSDVNSEKQNLSSSGFTCAGKRTRDVTTCETCLDLATNL